MRRLFTLLLLMCSWAFVFAGDTEPINLVFIGNSITYGANLSSPSTQAPPVKVAAMVKEQTGRAVYYRNCGLSGSATPNWMPGQTLFTNADNAATELQRANPGVLFFSMMLGTNDTHEGYKTSPEKYYQNMKTIIEELLKRHPEAHIIVNYPTWYSPNTHNGAVYLQAGLDRLKTYIPQITRLCNLFQQSVRPQVWPGDPTVFNFFENQTQYFVAENGNSGVFYLHPNLTGGTKLAEFWTKSIIEHLGDLQPLHSADELLLDKARTAAATCMRIDKNSLTPGSSLIGNGQLSSNAMGTSDSKLDNLLDLNPSSYFEVDELSTSPKATPWLQVDLQGKKVGQIVMALQQRSDAAVSASHNWMPTDVTLQASSDGEHWTRLTAFHDMHTTNGYFISPIVKVGDSFRYLRLCVNNTASLHLTEGGALTWNLSEFQLYSVEADPVNSPYATVEGLKEACDALTTCLAQCEQALATGTLTDEQRSALAEATKRVTSLYAGEKPSADTDPDIVYIGDLNSDDTYSYSKKKGLITLKMYLKTNSEEKNSGTYFGTGNLLSTSTDYNTIIWHTDWTTNPLPAGVDNYLQAHLKSKQSSICFSMIGSNWSSTYDTPDRIVIMATNTPSVESSWQEIVELPDLIPEELHSVHPAFYDSPRIDLGAEYSDIRFVIKETVNHRLNRNGNIYVSLARFQVYAPTLVNDNVKTLEALVKKLSQKSSGVQVGNTPGLYPAEPVEAFRNALSKAILLLNMNLSQEEALEMQNELNAVYQTLEQSLIRLEAGYYWIQSAHQGFEKTQGMAKALKADASDDLQWTSFDATDATQLFRLEADGADWKLQSVATGQFVGKPNQKGKRVTMDSDGALVSIASDNNSYLTLSVQGEGMAIETTKNDAMVRGYVACYSPSQKDLASFALIPVTDEAELSKLCAQAAVVKALMEADEALCQAKGCGSRELLTDGSQLYANSQMSGFPVSNLLDKSTAYDKVIFHTVWGNGALSAAEKNYLQVNLREPQQTVRFSMIGSSWNGTYDTPDDYVIMATETPTVESSWKVVARLHDMIPQLLHTTYPAFYTSPLIHLGGAYTHLRFVVESTVNNRSNGHGNIYFSLARFQVYGDANDSKYSAFKELASAVDDMAALSCEIKALPLANVTAEQVAILVEKTELVRKLMDGETAITTVSSAAPAAPSAIYSLSGQRLGKSQKGVNIIDGRKVLK